LRITPLGPCTAADWVTIGGVVGSRSNTASATPSRSRMARSQPRQLDVLLQTDAVGLLGHQSHVVAQQRARLGVPARHRRRTGPKQPDRDLVVFLRDHVTPAVLHPARLVPKGPQDVGYLRDGRVVVQASLGVRAAIRQIEAARWRHRRHPRSDRGLRTGLRSRRPAAARRTRRQTTAGSGPAWACTAAACAPEASVAGAWERSDAGAKAA
jgi:hypothetical protein